MSVRHRIGFNWNGRSYDQATIMDISRRTGGAVQLVMHDPGTAQRIYEESHGKVVVISRVNWPDDTSHIPYDELATEWNNLKARFPNVHWYFPNEPVVTDQRDLRRLLSELITFMHKLRGLSVKAVIGNFAWANILHAADVEAGVWDKFIVEASAWTNEGLGFIGGHDYTSGALPFGAAKRNPYDMLEPSLVQPDRWPSREEVFETRWQDNWLLFRWAMLAKRAAFLGVPMFKIIITEGLWDRMPNLELDTEVSPGVKRTGVVRLLDALWGYARGPLDQRKWFRQWWPQWTAEQAAIRQLDWFEDMMPEYVAGVCLFAGNKDWPSYNFLDWPEFIAALAGYSRRNEPVIDEKSGVVKLVRPNGYFKLSYRSEPVVNSGNVLGLIPPFEDTELIIFYRNVDGTPTERVVGNITFMPMRWAGVVGWAAVNLLLVQDKPASEPIIYRDALAEVADRLSTIVQDIHNLLA